MLWEPCLAVALLLVVVLRPLEEASPVFEDPEPMAAPVPRPLLSAEPGPLIPVEEADALPAPVLALRRMPVVLPGVVLLVLDVFAIVLKNVCGEKKLTATTCTVRWLLNYYVTCWCFCPG